MIIISIILISITTITTSCYSFTVTACLAGLAQAKDFFSERRSCARFRADGELLSVPRKAAGAALEDCKGGNNHRVAPTARGRGSIAHSHAH